MGLEIATPDVAQGSTAPAVCHREPIRRTLLTCPVPDPVIDVLNIHQTANLTVPAILNEGTANLAPQVILNQSISDNLHAIYRGVASGNMNLADHPRSKASHNLFKTNISRLTGFYCTVCKERTVVIK